MTRIALNGWTRRCATPSCTRSCTTVTSLPHPDRTLLRAWRDEGVVRADLDPDATAPILLWLVLGYVVQRALFGDEVDPASYERGITDLLGG